MLQPFVGIRTPSPLSGLYGLECYSKDPKQQEAFVSSCLLIPRDFRAFHQSGCGQKDADYNLFEFWTELTPAQCDYLLHLAEDVAGRCGLRLEIR